MNKITEKQLLIDKIVEAIQDTKGEDIMIFDLSKIENSVAQTFIICTGNSNTQVSAISGNIQKKVRNDLTRPAVACRRDRKLTSGFYLIMYLLWYTFSKEKLANIMILRNFGATQNYQNRKLIMNLTEPFFVKIFIKKI
jgi:hypothetical protein